jgi:predicted nucleotide-binding protein
MDDSPTSPTPSIIGRFRDDQLIETLCDQSIVRGEKDIAEQIKLVCKLQDISKDTHLIEQEACDDDLYLIISGTFDVYVNQRKTGSRQAGMHIGEMAVIDSTSRRNATVVAAEQCVIAQISSKDFIAIANNFPQVWRRLSVELSRRLKERNKFHKQPRSQPAIFIGSTVEGLPIAREIQAGFSHDPFVPKVWEKGIFSPGATPIEDLVRTASESDFCVIVVTPDDKVISRGESNEAPRDNVIFELGLFVGSIGRDRTLMVMPRNTNLKIPSDLLGVNPLTYDNSKNEWQSTEIPTICQAIRKIIKEKGSI